MTSEAPSNGRSLSLRDRLLLIRKEEIPPLLWSFFYFFFLLCSYYVLRPVRDEMGIRAGVGNLPWLFSAVFGVMLLLTPIFGLLFARFSRRKLLPVVYLFFASNLGLFWLLFESGQYVHQATIAFFIWVSVFNLFAVSVFWSFMADLWNTDEARRLYGFISAGGTAGAIVGPALTALFSKRIGPMNLVLISLGCLLVCVTCIRQLREWAVRRVANDTPKEGERPSILAGVRLALSSPYLLLICAYVVLYSTTSTFLYIQQAEIINKSIHVSAERTALFAQMDLAVNVLTLVMQIFVLQPLLSRLGLVVALTVLPILSLVGFLGLGLYPTLQMLIAVVVLRRAGEFAIAKPSRETLFNVLGPVEKYQAKNFMDTVVYRGGDTASSWLLSWLKSVGFGIVGVSLLAAPLAAVWAVIGALLGQLHKRLHEKTSAAEKS
ncbi:MAG TPA: MFS transporter [Pseudomonadota bacterium]|jgi:AAA family ATP:ADP antiporter|nr:MFS transporter [Pseudomonadota bacterium]HNF98349.1 MFS transporter [Pseudomonadota bacterium]HNI59740.1 MFS transporter [Pseudomonadota bacterium]HNO69180.1 MFS transporter [Pseudomonadota bacterium]